MFTYKNIFVIFKIYDKIFAGDSMKKLFIGLIELYQKTPLHSHSYCKFYPTCSEYTKSAIEKHGLFKGSILSLKRILKCNPFSKGGVDLVPDEKQIK